MNSKDYSIERVRFAEWSLQWLDIYKRGIVKSNTYWGTYYNPVVKHLNPYFGEMFLDEIRPIHVQKFFKEQGKLYALETLKKMRAALNAIFCSAIENEKCVKNPVSKSLRLKSYISPIEKSAYTKAQYNTVFNFAKTHKYGLDIMVLMETGISRSELLGLEWDYDIDVINNAIRVNQGTVSQKNTETDKWETVSDGLKNVYRKRIIPVSVELMKRIMQKPRTIYIGGNKKKGTPPKAVHTDYVFHSPTGKIYSPDNWYKRVYMPFMRDMHNEYTDIPILHAHELRHTRATLWNENGLRLLSLAYLGGWTDLKMLRKRYAHFSVSKLREELRITD